MDKRIHYLSLPPEPCMMMGVLERRDGYKLERHNHLNFYQTIYVTSGRLNVITDNNEYTLSTGMIHILPPGYYHSLDSDGYCQFGLDVSRGLPNLASFYDAFEAPATLVVPELSEYVRKLTEMKYDDRLSIETGRSLCTLILLGAAKAALSRDTVPLKGRIIEYIDSNLHESTTLEDIAAALYISPSHLERMSNVFFGSGVIALFNRKRFERACLKLVSSNMPIRSVGESLGFSEASTFSAFFKRYAGCSPAEYRRRHMD